MSYSPQIPMKKKFDSVKSVGGVYLNLHYQVKTLIHDTVDVEY